MRVLAGRRPEVMFLAALVVLGIAITLRMVQPQSLPSPAFDTSAPAPPAVELSSERMISQLQGHLKAQPDDTSAYAQLGLAYIQRVRETADPSLYDKAGAAFDEALKRDANQIDALIGQGSLALSRHHFVDALGWGEKAKAINPYRAQVYGVIGDAQVELGRYDDAIATFQKMVDTRPDLSSYSRVSYIRELQGDVPGAIDAMRRAVNAGNSASEQTLWTQVQLGNLYFNSGDLAQAEAKYTQALQSKADYVYAIAGLAKVRVAQERYGEALTAYRTIVERLPLPEFVIAYGELLETMGKDAEAKQQYGLVHTMQQLNAAAGMDVDMELALFDADHGNDPAKTVALARAAFERRPSIVAADALAWALYCAGRAADARPYSQQALRLGTRDALIHYHAGMIALAVGDKAAARTLLDEALAINPYFSASRAQDARHALEALGK